MSNKHKRNKKQTSTTVRSTADKAQYSRVDVAIWCNEVSARLKEYARFKKQAERAELIELAENAALWAQWCYRAPINEFNAQCAYWAKCEE